jgi:hypothetical protein
MARITGAVAPVDRLIEDAAQGGNAASTGCGPLRAQILAGNNSALAKTTADIDAAGDPAGVPELLIGAPVQQ